MIVYGGSLFVISLLVWVLWGTVVRDRALLRSEVPEDEAQAILRAATPSLGFYAGVILLAIVAPRVAAVGYLVIAVLMVLRARGVGAEAEADAAGPSSG